MHFYYSYFLVLNIPFVKCLRRCVFSFFSSCLPIWQALKSNSIIFKRNAITLSENLCLDEFEHLIVALLIIFGSSIQRNFCAIEIHLGFIVWFKSCTCEYFIHIVNFWLRNFLFTCASNYDIFCIGNDSLLSNYCFPRLPLTRIKYIKRNSVSNPEWNPIFYSQNWTLKSSSLRF